MSSLFLHVIKLNLTEAESSNVFLSTRCWKDHRKYWLGRDGEKHVKLCLDVSQSS